MIELKIPNNTAVMLITERMKLEFEQRVKFKMYPYGTTIFSLSYDELIELAEISALDLVFLLPAGIHYENNNLGSILFKAICSLSKVFQYEEFNAYSMVRVNRIYKPIQDLFKNSEKNNSFLNN
ncbi:MAG: hypothetical protein V1773_18395 [bacterium]